MVETTKPARLISYEVSFDINSDMSDDEPVCSDTLRVSAPDKKAARKLARTQVEEHPYWDERIHPMFSIQSIQRLDLLDDPESPETPAVALS